MTALWIQYIDYAVKQSCYCFENSNCGDMSNDEML